MTQTSKRYQHSTQYKMCVNSRMETHCKGMKCIYFSLEEHLVTTLVHTPYKTFLKTVYFLVERAL